MQAAASLRLCPALLGDPQLEERARQQAGRLQVPSGAYRMSPTVDTPDLISTAIALSVIKPTTGERHQAVGRFLQSDSYWLTPPDLAAAGNVTDLRMEYLARVSLGQITDLAGLVI